MIATVGGFAFALRLHWRKIRTSQFLSQAIIVLLLIWQGVSHCRHLSILAIVCGFFASLPLHQLIDFSTAGFRRRVSELTDRDGKYATRPGISPIASVALMAICLFNFARLAPQLNEVSVDRSEFPVAAMQFMRDRNLHGKVVVTFNWAQYAIGCFAEVHDPSQQSRVAVDGRFETCYPREITNICFDFWLGTDDPKLRYRSPRAAAFDPARALEFHNPDLVLLARDQAPSVREMQRHTDEWELLYQDSLAQLWGRRSVYDSPESPLYLDVSLRHITDDPQTGTVLWPAVPVGQIHWHQIASRPVPDTATPAGHHAGG